MRKKSVFYLLMSVTIMGIIVANMLVFSNRFKKKESSSLEIVRNEFIDTTIYGMSYDGLDRFMGVAAKKALAELASHKADGNTIKNISNEFDSLVARGLLNNTFRYLTPTLARFLGVTTNYYFVLGFRIDKLSVNSTLSHLDPWNVHVSSKITYKINVPRSKFSGVIDTTREYDISIFGLPDPLEGWKITSQWDENDTYPSFVDRLEGKTTASEYGICRNC